jgi:hypothetical protein
VEVDDRLKRDLDVPRIDDPHDRRGEPLLRSSCAELIDDHLAEHRHEARIALIEVGSGRSAEAAQGAERLAVGKSQWHPDERPDADAVGCGQIGQQPAARRIADDRRDLTGDQAATESGSLDRAPELADTVVVDGRDRITYRQPKRVGVAGDRGIYVSRVGQLGDERRIEFEVAARELDHAGQAHRFERRARGLIHDREMVHMRNQPGKRLTIDESQLAHRPDERRALRDVAQVDGRPRAEPTRALPAAERCGCGLTASCRASPERSARRS